MTDSILTKRKNYELCQAGAYGNRILQWNSIEEWRASGYDKPVAMRVALQAGGGPKAFHVPPNVVDVQVLKWEIAGIPRECVRLSEMVDGLRLLQGHYFNDVYVQDGETRWGYFRFTMRTGAMPLAMAKEERSVYGLRADLLIRNAMTPSSYEDWKVLLDRYPGHVLEFSVWESCLGDTPGRNAVVWEVRRY
jgi:hypothetical protein